MLRRTKIVATLGPACSEASTLQAMLAAGVDVLRINFSHVDSSIFQIVEKARTIASELNHPLAIMADLQGPKLRIGRFKDNQITLLNDQHFILNCSSQELGDEHSVSVAYTNLCYELTTGDHLLLDDGLIELKVDSIEPPYIHCVVVEGGVLRNNKGLNRKGGGLAARALTEKDKKDLQTAIDLEVDYLTLSFVKDAQDIKEARDLLNGKAIPIIAKIERTEALHHLIEIINATDAVMVARGDLGVEIGPAEVPAIQKKLLSKADAWIKLSLPRPR